MFKFIASRIRPSARSPVLPKPDEPLFILPDLHGSLALLDAALHWKDRDFPLHRLVVLGDMIDRGADSAGVLRCLLGLPDATCLMGNHEAMLLDVLDDPVRNGPNWLRFGGQETLLSFGWQGLPHGPHSLQELAVMLPERMGATSIDWIRNRPLYCQSGNVVMVHAGLDPRRALHAQSRQVLLWGHPDCGRISRDDGIFVVHGHTIVPEARVRRGCLALDTGAYATGTLTFSVIDLNGLNTYKLTMEHSTSRR